LKPPTREEQHPWEFDFLMVESQRWLTPRPFQVAFPSRGDYRHAVLEAMQRDRNPTVVFF